MLSDSLIWHIKLTWRSSWIWSVMQLFFSNIRIYASYLWAVIISTFFVCRMKTSPWLERGLSSVTRLWIRSLKFDLLYIRYHSHYDGLDTDTESSLLLGVRFSSTKCALQNIWQKLRDNSCSNKSLLGSNSDFEEYFMVLTLWLLSCDS